MYGKVCNRILARHKNQMPFGAFYFYRDWHRVEHIGKNLFQISFWFIIIYFTKEILWNTWIFMMNI